MGVMATYCAICGAPANHDYYIEEGQEEFPFEEGHQWLKAAVGLGKNSVVHGMVDNNELITDKGKCKFVEDGLGGGDLTIVHSACWELAGSPLSVKKIPQHYSTEIGIKDSYGAIWSHPWQSIKKYMNQLFDFQTLKDDGNLWMIEDPTTAKGALNKERILGILSFTPEVINGVDANRIEAEIKETISQGHWHTVDTEKMKASYRYDVNEYLKGRYLYAIRVRHAYFHSHSYLPWVLFNSSAEEVRKRIESSYGGILACLSMENVTKGAPWILEYVVYSNDFRKTINKILPSLYYPPEIITTKDPEWTRFQQSVEFIKEKTT